MDLFIIVAMKLFALLLPFRVRASVMVIVMVMVMIMVILMVILIVIVIVMVNNHGADK